MSNNALEKVMPMDRPNIPLNALRCFEVAARQGSFTNAAVELCVTQAAVSHQILRLEEQIGVKLFHRTSKGLLLTPEGEALLPVLTASLDRISGVLDRFTDGRYYETINVGVVTTFAVGWLAERLTEFEKSHLGISIRLFTNNNRVDIAREGLDVAIRFAGWPLARTNCISPDGNTADSDLRTVFSVITNRTRSIAKSTAVEVLSY